MSVKTEIDLWQYEYKYAMLTNRRLGLKVLFPNVQCFLYTIKIRKKFEETGSATDIVRPVIQRFACSISQISLLQVKVLPDCVYFSVLNC